MILKQIKNSDNKEFYLLGIHANIKKIYGVCWIYIDKKYFDLFKCNYEITKIITRKKSIIYFLNGNLSEV